MKLIKYKFVSAEINRGTEEEPEIEQIIFTKVLPYSEANEEIARREACNSEYTIEDDGKPEPAAEPTTDQILNAMLGVM